MACYVLYGTVLFRHLTEYINLMYYLIRLWFKWIIEWISTKMIGKSNKTKEIIKLYVWYSKLDEDRSILLWLKFSQKSDPENVTHNQCNTCYLVCNVYFSPAVVDIFIVYDLGMGDILQATFYNEKEMILRIAFHRIFSVRVQLTALSLLALWLLSSLSL